LDVTDQFLGGGGEGWCDLAGDNKLACFQAPFQFGDGFGVGGRVVHGIALPPIGLAHRTEYGIPNKGALVGVAREQAGEKPARAKFAHLGDHISPGFGAGLVPI